MGLKIKNLTLSGIKIPEAYVKLEELNYKAGQVCNLVFSVYSDVNLRYSDFAPYAHLRVSGEGIDFSKPLNEEAYKCLKLVYSDTEDVLTDAKTSSPTITKCEKGEDNIVIIGRSFESLEGFLLTTYQNNVPFKTDISPDGLFMLTVENYKSKGLLFDVFELQVKAKNLKWSDKISIANVSLAENPVLNK